VTAVPPARRPRCGIALATLTGAAGLAALLVLALRRPADRPIASGLSIASVLAGGDTAGYARALAPRPFRSPADHGPHPEFRNEWWYVTGNLAAKLPEGTGRPFGFQLTFFRSALAPPASTAAPGSAWRTSQAWLAHFAVSDLAGGRFHSAERQARGALGLAGARAEPFRVWVGPWELAAVGTASFPAHLAAATDDIALDLTLDPGKPAIAQGDRGLSQKGPEAGNASYYFSLPRLPAHGRITVEGRSYEVAGQAWLDREWSTSALSRGQVGWDWLALQLADGSEIMLYRLRRSDGRPDPFSRATEIRPDGSTRVWPLGEIGFEASGRFASPRSGAIYPDRWRIRIPGSGLDLDVRPALADQELDVGFRYWEGAVRVAGRRAGRPVTGVGYVELTGYAERAEGAGRRP
jgi:predicted secreted hydrolase